ncbi:hypothetical protein PGIGA_G00175930 [Pangasianodon gigas]|uniref:Uncharacterized protein n=1 Tax=Pangasianodon gigas TaxID=30993 RepID=A0ACC5XUF9_PANGG|nr:hypothetical protein [Pangasianodon gigas]
MMRNRIMQVIMRPVLRYGLTQRRRAGITGPALRNNGGSVRKELFNGGETAGGRCYRLTAVCVLLLCVFLLTVITVLWIKFNTLSTENNQLQTSYNTLTIERD